MSNPTDWRLLIHGGAGVMPRGALSAEEEAACRAGLAVALAVGARILSSGGHAIDAVEAAVHELEDDPNFNAGRGVVLDRDGFAELDAAIMDGRDRSAGAVTQVRTIRNPIHAARAVKDHTPHVLIAGPGAVRVAVERGLAIVDPSYFVTPRRQAQLKRALVGEVTLADKRGTVGAVARDARGNLAAATSTGGMAAKMAGRVGDSPIIGAGAYADNASAAVSATGHGEMFIRATVARMICARMEMQGLGAEEAARVTLAEVKAMGGDGGVIVIGHDGDAAFAMNTDGMFRGMIDAGGSRVAIYADEA
jgi:beta-aspartyl-peptidase (threonine type)